MMSTIQTLITDHIDIWTAADTEKKSGRGRSSGNAASVYGIKKLRELILELAVRGKLVQQDANDEPASELLKRIQAEKAKLIAEGQIKKAKPLEEIADDEKLFELPDGWEWTRVAHVGHDWGQKTPDSDFTYIEVSAIDSKRGVVSFPELVKPEDAPSRARKVVKKDTVIYSTVRPYLLNIAVIEQDFSPEPIASTAFAIVHPFCSMPSRYFLCFFRSPIFVRYVESVQMGIAYPAINDGQFFSGLIPLPPIAEQHRIVAKVDELMALCDQLETQYSNAAEAHEKLVNHLLGTLTLSQSAEDFSANWQRIAAHFDTLFTTEASIDSLKQTLLQLAVMGKLVPQNANDEPASELLKRIQAEKAKLIAEGKIKKAKPLPLIADEEKPFGLPAGWEWGRAEYISIIIVDCPHSTPKFVDSGMLCVDTNSIKQGQLLAHKIRYVDIETFSNRNRRLAPRSGDIVFAREGSVGESFVIPEGMECCLGQRVMLFRPCNRINPEYFRLALTEPGSLNRLLLLHKGIGARHINVADMRAALIPLPPFSEQNHIVDKVDELMAICDRLKFRITKANQLQQKLADVVVEQAIL